MKFTKYFRSDSGKKMGSRSSLDLMSSNGLSEKKKSLKKDTVFFGWVGGWAVVWVACGSHERIGEGDREGNARQLSLCMASL
jgi:hypothetical protein